MVMIHGVAGLLYDYYTLADLKKLQKDFDASERAIAEIYHARRPATVRPAPQHDDPRDVDGRAGGR